MYPHPLQKLIPLARPHAGRATATRSRALELEGHTLIRGVFPPDEIAALRAEILEVYEQYPADLRQGRTSAENAEMFRYEMFNRSALCQSVIAREELLSVVEPLLGHDCHVISCTAWRNPAGQKHAPLGQEWHVDGGPFVPRAPGTAWPPWIPYPVFIVATHVYLERCTLDDGPTAVIPGTHRSGCVPPIERRWDVDLNHRGRAAVPHLAEPGDVGFFVSEVWHRRLPPTRRSAGRFFLQTNYGRRDIAQRVQPTDEVHHVREAAIARATTPRERTLLGLHAQSLYDG